MEHSPCKLPKQILNITASDDEENIDKLEDDVMISESDESDTSNDGEDEHILSTGTSNYYGIIRQNQIFLS